MRKITELNRLRKLAGMTQLNEAAPTVSNADVTLDNVKIFNDDTGKGEATGLYYTDNSEELPVDITYTVEWGEAETHMQPASNPVCYVLTITGEGKDIEVESLTDAGEKLQSELLKATQSYMADEYNDAER